MSNKIRAQEEGFHWRISLIQLFQNHIEPELSYAALEVNEWVVILSCLLRLLSIHKKLLNWKQLTRAAAAAGEAQLLAIKYLFQSHLTIASQ